MPQHQLYGLRGKAYVTKYKQLYEELKEDIKKDVLEIVEKTEKFTPKDLGKICMKYRIPLTAMDDYLNSIFPSNQENCLIKWVRGTVDRLKDRGMKARDIGVIWSNND